MHARPAQAQNGGLSSTKKTAITWHCNSGRTSCVAALALAAGLAAAQDPPADQKLTGGALLDWCGYIQPSGGPSDRDARINLGIT